MRLEGVQGKARLHRTAFRKSSIFLDLPMITLFDATVSVEGEAR